MAALVAAGRGSQLLLSHGTCSSLQLAAFGGPGLTHVQQSVLPRLVRAGVAPEQAQSLCSSNGASLLRWWRPAERAPRVTKIWECAGCHSRYHEAANPAEVLPEDHVYYEKFDKRYCSMHCMGAHRKAGFVEPFECAPPPPGKPK